MSPTDPNVRIVVFDGVCNVCSGWVRFLERHRIEPPFKLVPMQSEEGKRLLVLHGIDPEDPTTFLVLDQGREFTQSDGSIHVVTALGGVWSAFALAKVIPKSWRDSLYQLLARNRYRWFGKRATCYLPR
jgi:predicted DCC family thiol-disulfide oxidoreductase YuxK